MGCSCGLVGSLIIDVGTGAERRSSVQRRPGLSVLFSIHVSEVEAVDALSITIKHKSPTDTTYTDAGTFSAITSDGVHAKHITGVKEQFYWELTCNDGKYVVDSMKAQSLDG